MSDPSIQSLPYLTRKMLDFENGTTFALSIDLLCPTTGTYYLRGFTKQGPFIYAMESANTDALQTFTFNLPDVPIFFTLVGHPSNTTVNVAYAIAHLVVNGDRNTILTQGQPSSLFGLTWPAQSEMPMFQQKGYQQSIVVAAVAAGSTYSYTCKANTWTYLRSLSFTFTCDANAANRFVFVRFDGNARVLAYPLAVITANQSVLFNFAEGIRDGSSATILSQSIPLPTNNPIAPQSSISILCTNMQVGDQITSIEAITEEFRSTS